MTVAINSDERSDNRLKRLFKADPEACKFTAFDVMLVNTITTMATVPNPNLLAMVLGSELSGL